MSIDPIVNNDPVGWHEKVNDLLAAWDGGAAPTSFGAALVRLNAMADDLSLPTMESLDSTAVKRAKINGLISTYMSGDWMPVVLGSSIKAFWSADRTDLITLSGTQVTSWKDVIAGYDMVQAVSGARPVWSADGFNGAPAVDYDGIDDQMTLTGVPLSFPIGSDPGEMWIVFDNEAAGADTTTRRVFNYGGTTNNNSRALTLAGVSGTQRLGGYVGNGASAGFSAVPPVDASGRRAARLQIDGGVATAIDGSDLTTKAVTTPATTDTMVRSGLGVSGTGPFNGKIRHIMLTGILAGDDLAKVWAWTEIQRRA
ncbi:hypothetical protein [Devosia alba]|uniref:hypothetical protein n=1 Tax=Devosia alba TaxID=3152360 RepID=UPI0032639962